jgi:hypothetical protein
MTTTDSGSDELCTPEIVRLANDEFANKVSANVVEFVVAMSEAALLASEGSS